LAGSTTMIICGIDPGLTGAITIVKEGKPFRVYDLSVVSSRIDCLNLASALKEHQVSVAYIERSQAMPGQGVSSTFKTGMLFGMIEGCLMTLGISIIEVVPFVWKRHWKLVGKDKESSRLLAIQRFPDYADLFARKKDHNRAEATLIAMYGAFAMYGASLVERTNAKGIEPR
jgi:crossover junction endodeoxyribonuclease RuvC